MSAPGREWEQVKHLRLLADTYDGVDAEEWAEAADTIERLCKEANGLARRLQSERARAERYRTAYCELLAETIPTDNA